MTHDEVLAELCGTLPALLGVDAVALFVDQPPVRCAAAVGLTAPLPEVMSHFVGRDREPLARWAATSGFAGQQQIPFTGQGKVGVLALLHHTPHPPSPLDGAALQGLVENILALGDEEVVLRSRLHQQEQRIRDERLHALGDMALGIAHDFNNVLNAILSHVGVLELRAALDHSDFSDTIALIKEAGRRGAETIARLQDFSRRRRDREFSEVDLSACVVQAIAMVTEQYPRLTIHHQITDDAVCAGDGSELRRVVDSLLGNAAEATGGNGLLSVSVDLIGRVLQLIVKDDGPGMSEGVRERAFDPFFSTKGPLVPGLGLSVAYGIIHRHGGRIELESSPGNGTRALVELPSVGERRAPLSPMPPLSPSPLAPALRVLLIEDDVDNREAMAALLALGGFNVTHAACGADGVRAFRGSSFDLVLTDLGLPDLSGWEVASSCKSISPSTPVVLITGWGLNVDGRDVPRRGVDLLIKKPIEPAHFLDQLAQLAGGRNPSSIG